MSMLCSYQTFCKDIDLLHSIEELHSLRSASSVSSMQKEFWLQRKIALSSLDPLDRERALVKLQWIQHFFGSSVPITRAINRFTAPHGLYGIFISAQATVGKRCVIFHQVTIGSNTLIDSKGAGFPVIGNDVFIGAGAKIIGNVTIGDHVRIGANCCVTKSIPPNSVIVNARPTLIQRDTAMNNVFYSHAEFLDKRFGEPVCDLNSILDKDLCFCLAEKRDLDEILKLCEERALWLRWKGFRASYALLKDFIGQLDDLILSHALYALRYQGNLAGVFSFHEGRSLHDTKDLLTANLGFVVTNVHYCGAGRRIVEHAEQMANKKNINLLICEIPAVNERLIALATQYGFILCRDQARNTHHQRMEKVLSISSSETSAFE